MAVFRTGTKTPAWRPAFGRICSNCCSVIGISDLLVEIDFRRHAERLAVSPGIVRLHLEAQADNERPGIAPLVNQIEAIPVLAAILGGHELPTRLAWVISDGVIA